MRASSRSQAGSSSSTTSGISSAWRATAAIGPSPGGAHPLEHQPLVGGVLVDDHQPVLGFGDDIGGGDLPARDAERIGRHRLDRRLGAGCGGVVEEFLILRHSIRHSRQSGNPAWFESSGTPAFAGVTG